MAARKLAQEVEKTFKKVHEGVAEFDEIYAKLEQTTNAAQKDKLEDQLKREIKKLQRMRDQIKTWHASSDIKDKGPLMEHRKLIETKMEAFKAVEKQMKTKAFSKEGLSAQSNVDPKQKERDDASQFLGDMIDELEQKVETLEVERETLGQGKKGKKGKMDTARANKIEEVIERHKWHQSRLELARRSLLNGSVDADQINGIKDSIQFYVQEGEGQDYDDDSMYDELNLDEEEEGYGLAQENDKNSSQDAQSLQGDTVEPDMRSSSQPKAKERGSTDSGSARKPAAQLKSPLPSIASLHPQTPSVQPVSSGSVVNTPGLKSAVPPAKPGELKYSIAAAAGADKSNVGIAPLPPPPSAHPAVGSSARANQSKESSTSSPSIASIPMAAAPSQPVEQKPAPAPAAPPAPAAAAPSNVPGPAAANTRQETSKAAPSRAAGKQTAAPEPIDTPKGSHTNGVTNGVKPAERLQEEESIYHLPSSLGDLMEAWESTKATVSAPNSLATQRLVKASRDTAPDAADAEPIRNYQPESWWDTSASWPKEYLPNIDNPALYTPTKLENDTLFYAFYYKQGTYQQYLAAKALKDQAWRFHKQYQTWFQRHEEPKNITEEFEQGTYRFFDYESTWMNRRKADFKFAYKFLEDEV